MFGEPLVRLTVFTKSDIPVIAFCRRPSLSSLTTRPVSFRHNRLVGNADGEFVLSSDVPESESEAADEKDPDI